MGKDDTIKITHEEWRKMKLYLFGRKKFEVDKDVYIYNRIKKIEELKKRNGNRKEN